MIKYIKYFINEILLGKRYEVGDMLYYYIYSYAHIRLKRSRVKEIFVTDLSFDSWYELENGHTDRYSDLYKNPVKLLEDLKREQLKELFQEASDYSFYPNIDNIKISASIISDVNRKLYWFKRR